MANRVMNATFLPRRDTAANWETKNPVLKNGEFITVITNAGAIRHKVGDGTKTYTQLPFEDEPLYNALAEKCDASNSVSGTLLASGWSDGQQTLSMSGVKANQNGYASLPQNVTDAQFEAAATAVIDVSAQADGTVTFICRGDVPQIDIPVVVTLLG